MVITKHSVVELLYELHENNAEGAFVEKTDADSPLVFLSGIGQMLPEFERQLEGRSAGEKLSFGIDAENAYGPLIEEAVVEIPRQTFAGHEDLLTLGNVIPMRGEDGMMLRGIVKMLTEQGVMMDFNHPMAGKNLWFSVEIIHVREAHPSEIEHGHVHQHGDHDHH
jgi:FKBP-type peptidyl-prolyl cis-trans isomerase SlyD